MGGASESTLQLPTGLNLDASLERFSRHGDDLMDRWDGHAFRRPFRLGSEVGALRLRRTDRAGRLRVTVVPGEAGRALTPRLGRMFVDEQRALAELCRRDLVIAALSRLHRGLFPVLWLDPLAALLVMVSAQQVNLAFALSVRRAILERLGRRLELAGDFVLVPDPERMAKASDEVWGSLRLTRAKARCLRALAAALNSGRLSFEALADASDAEVIGQLTELPGIGPWTASQYLSRVLGRPVVVAGDLGVRKAVQLAYGLERLPLPHEVLEITAGYGTATFTAQQLLLYHLGRVAHTGAARRARSSAEVSAGGGAPDLERVVPATRCAS
ncbi:MAG: DNA-3-methyladenine glycosylase family protein [Candidatus Dormibacteria bacterium]